MSVEMKWYGDDLLRAIEDEQDDALFEAAKVIQVEAQKKVPVRSGKLKRSIYAASASQHNYNKVGKTNRRIKPAKGTAIVAAGAWYGRLVEYGTKKMKARSFLRPALDQNRHKAAKAYIDYMNPKLELK